MTAILKSLIVSENPELAPFLVEERIRHFLGFGGVRIEDDVLITKRAPEVLTDAPKTVADVTAVMAQA